MGNSLIFPFRRNQLVSCIKADSWKSVNDTINLLTESLAEVSASPEQEIESNKESNEYGLASTKEMVNRGGKPARFDNRWQALAFEQRFGAPGSDLVETRRFILAEHHTARQMTTPPDR